MGMCMRLCMPSACPRVLSVVGADMGMQRLTSMGMGMDMGMATGAGIQVCFLHA